MPPPRHLVVCNHSSVASNDDVAYWVAAVNKQMAEHVAPAWDGEPPGCAFYGSTPKIPANEAAVIGIVDDDLNSASAGYHAVVGDLVYGLVDMSQSDIPSRVLSHEAIEMYADPALDRQFPGPDGLLYYAEPADPVQADGYLIDVELFGQKRRVEVSDFVLPAWYREHATGPFNWLDTLTAPFQIAGEGYALAENDYGRVLFLSAARGARMNAAKLNRTSRTNRIVRHA